MLHARAGAAAIAAALALSPTYAASPKPIVDLSQSPAVSGTPAAATPAKPPAKKIGPVDERTAEIGGGALAVLLLGGAALAMRSRKRRREDEEAWDYDAVEPAAEAPEPTTQTVHETEPPIVAPEPSAFAWGNGERRERAESDCEDLDSWIERAECGPTADNPSHSLKKRLKRAAFFEKREREVAAGEAAPIDPDAGLPEAMVEEHEREVA
jgi:hypothetical protein